MAKLCISEDLKLPIDAVTQRISILGKTRSGKSHTAGVIVEEVLKARQQVVILDPKGDWWGLRSSADGKSAGLQILIMGGKHGDVPLEPTAGALVADLVINERISVILDFSLFESKADEIRFVTAFLDRLYRKNTEPILLVIDEGDVFAPQKPEKNETIMLNRMETICRRGAGRGIGVVLISQRSAAIHKGCLSQTELMICHQTTSPQDKDAIKGWVVDHDDEDRREDFLSAIPKLKKGVAIVWSPSWLEIYKQVAIRRKETYDSGDAPKVGQHRRAPKILAEVDLDRLRKHMAETIEKAKQEDPKLLRQENQLLRGKLAGLERQLQLSTQTTVQPKTALRPITKTVVETKVEIRKLRVIQEVEIKAIHGVLKRLEKIHAQFSPILEKVDQRLRERLEKLNGSLNAATQAALTFRDAPRAALGYHPLEKHVSKHQDERIREAHDAFVNARPVKIPPAAPRKPLVNMKHTPPIPDDEPLSDLQLRQLTGLLDFERIGVPRVDRKWLAGWLGMSLSGHFKNNFYGLQKRGLIAYDQMMLYLTEEGRQVAPASELEISIQTILDRCASAVEDLSGRQLRYLHSVHPEFIAREDLAAALGMSLSGHFKNCFYDLHNAGMIDYGSGENKMKLRCADWLFLPEGVPVS